MATQSLGLWPRPHAWSTLSPWLHQRSPHGTWRCTAPYWERLAHSLTQGALAVPRLMIYTTGGAFSLVLDTAEARLEHMGQQLRTPDSPGTVFRPGCPVR